MEISQTQVIPIPPREVREKRVRPHVATKIARKNYAISPVNF